MADHHFTLRSFDEIFDLSKQLAQYFHNPDEVQPGIYELLVNALEHGNLGIGYDTKTQLLRQNRWQEEISQRLSQPEHTHKTVSVVVKSCGDGHRLIIRDAGSGFDWQSRLRHKPLQTARHGRGLHIAKHCGMPLQFNATGNEVTLAINS